MTRTPIFARFAQLPSTDKSRKKQLQQPFLSPGGSRHTTLALDKSSLRVRWLILLLTSLVMLGNYYCYDNPAALYKNFQDRFHDVHNFEYTFDLMYSVYSLPNIVLPLFGGLLVDRVGVLFSLNLFALLILAGQLVFASGCSLGSLHLMLIGRAIFGFGGESISVAQSSLVAQWFKDKELAFALGISLSISRFGSVINNTVSPWVAVQSSVAAALWVGVLACGLSLGAALLLTYIDRKATRNIASASKTVVEGGDALLGTAKPTDKPRGGSSPLAQLSKFSAPFWMLAASCVVVYGCVLPFNNIASGLLQDRDFFPLGTKWTDEQNNTFVYGESGNHTPGLACAEQPKGHASAFCTAQGAAERTAGLVMSEPYIMSALLTPLLGTFVDRYGCRAFLVLASALSLASVHLLFALTSIPATLLLLGLGLGYSVFASVIWPSIPSVVAPAHLGSAYGVITGMQNFGLFLIPLLVGAILSSGESQNRFRNVEFFFFALGVLGVGVGVVLNFHTEARTELNTPRGMLAEARWKDEAWTPSPVLGTVRETRRGEEGW